MGRAVDGLRRRLQQSRANELIVLRTEDLQRLVSESDARDNECERWIRRIKVLEERLHNIIALASGIDVRR